MIFLHDNNYKETLTDILSLQSTCIVMIGKKYCENCMKTHSNISRFKHTNQHNNFLCFCIDDYSNHELKSKTFEFNRMTEYPFTVVYYGSFETKEFYEGIITEEILSHIDERSLEIKEKNKNTDI